ncbi:MAG TPA: DUF3631 domain-containing protein [Candidatus Acidoferrales bacterium]|nr:DUF3631 domain-containing protein [Candidatus Acidoferrales bacterium]
MSTTNEGKLPLGRNSLPDDYPLDSIPGFMEACQRLSVSARGFAEYTDQVYQEFERLYATNATGHFLLTGRISAELSAHSRRALFDVASSFLELERAQRAAVGTLVEPDEIMLPPGHDEALAEIEVWLNDEAAAATEFETIAARLALLTDEEYALRRAKTSKRLNIRSVDLDSAVRKRRPTVVVEAIEEDDFGLTDTVPWEEPVDGPQLFRDVTAFVKRFVVFPDETDVTKCGLWVIATHCPENFDILARYGVTAIAKSCGKTTLLSVIRDLVERPLPFDNLSVAFVYRAAEDARPTFLIDEFDSFGEDYPELIGVLNSGHKKGGFVGRIDKNDAGEMKPRRFKTYAPVAYGMIAKPKEATLVSRTLFTDLLKKLPTDVVEDYDKTERPELELQAESLRRRICRWVCDHREEIRGAKPALRDLSNRDRDNWRALLKIATVLGEPALSAAREAAAVSVDDYDSNITLALLRDVRNIFHTRKKAQVISLSVLAADLRLQTSSPWPSWKPRSEPGINANELSGLLGQLGLPPTTPGKKSGFWVQTNQEQQKELFDKPFDVNERRLQGVRREWFDRLFKHHLAGEDPETVAVISTGEACALHPGCWKR